MTTRFRVLRELKQCGPETTALVTAKNAHGLRPAIRNLLGRIDDSYERAYMFSPLLMRNLFHRYGFTDLKFFGGMKETVIADTAVGRR